MIKKDIHIVSFSGGKDSTAMLLRLLESGMPVDMILFNDTGLEFEQLYDHINRVEQYITKYTDVIASRQNSTNASAPIRITALVGRDRTCGGVQTV